MKDGGNVPCDRRNTICVVHTAIVKVLTMWAHATTLYSANTNEGIWPWRFPKYGGLAARQCGLQQATDTLANPQPPGVEAQVKSADDQSRNSEDAR